MGYILHPINELAETILAVYVYSVYVLYIQVILDSLIKFTPIVFLCIKKTNFKHFIHEITEYQLSLDLLYDSLNVIQFTEYRYQYRYSVSTGTCMPNTLGQA